MALQPEAVEAETVDSEETFFFKFVGGVQFVKPDQPIDAPGFSRLVVTSSTYGITVFSDLSGACQLALAAGPAVWGCVQALLLHLISFTIMFNVFSILCFRNRCVCCPDCRSGEVRDQECWRQNVRAGP